MTKKESKGFFQAGPFSATGGNFVIAAATGLGFGNTVAQCFPIRVDGKVIEAAEIASLLAALLNARMDKHSSASWVADEWWRKLHSPDSGMYRFMLAYAMNEYPNVAPPPKRRRK